jgi:predicted CoA-binding protein
MVLSCYLQHGLPVVAVNPKQATVEGVPSFASLREVPATVRAASVVAPPAAALRIVEDAQARGIGHLWFQPGAEDAVATAAAERAGIAVIAGGPCLLVALGFRDV